MLPRVLEYGTTIKVVTSRTWVREYYKKCYLAYLVDLQKHPNPPNTPLYYKTWVPVSQVHDWCKHKAGILFIEFISFVDRDKFILYINPNVLF